MTGGELAEVVTALSESGINETAHDMYFQVNGDCCNVYLDHVLYGIWDIGKKQWLKKGGENDDNG